MSSVWEPFLKKKNSGGGGGNNRCQCQNRFQQLSNPL